MDNLLMVLGALLLTGLILWLCPLLNIWALNTLFPALAIPYNPATWAASLVMFSSMTGVVKAMTNRE